jgi:SP family sugar:H+ symporter-like MFS transporter
MGISSFMDRVKPAKSESQFSSQAVTPSRADSTSIEKDNLTLDDSPVKYLTWRSFILGLCVSMGGFIFGYSTGRSHNTVVRNATLIEPRSNLGFHYHGRLQAPLR